LSIAFEPIKTQLKRDLSKYEDYIDKQSVNGSKGGRPKKANETEKTQPFFQEPKKADNVIDNVNDIDTDKKVFKKPSIEDVKTYMKEQGMNDISERWMSHYESNGWLVGKNKMKDWKASVRTWKLNNLQTEEIKTNKPKIAVL